MVHRFAKRAGIAIGVLVVWFAILFAAIAVVKDRVPVDLPSTEPVIDVGGTYVTASGTWVIEGDRQGIPLQTTKIICEKELRRCSMSTAKVYNDLLMADLDVYDVVSWESGRIVFKDDAPLCASYVFTIDLATRATNGVRRKKATEANSEPCVGLSEELRMSLKGGFEVVRELKDEAYPWFGKLARAPLMLF